MPFPNKFKNLIELKKDDVQLPEIVWLTYAVCVCEKDSCGWQGWVIDGVFKKPGTHENLLPSHPNDSCPICGKSLFRTEIEIKFERSSDQSPNLQIRQDYEVEPPRYCDDEE